jgi:hypothetical protein
MKSSAQTSERERRAAPFLQELGHVPLARGTETIHEGWLDLAATQLNPHGHGVTASDIPSCLWSPGEDIFGDWSEAAARSALLHYRITRGSYMASALALGHLHNARTLTRAVLTTAPTSHQKRDFITALGALDLVNGPAGEDGRRSQAQLTNVPPPVTRALRVPLPHHAHVTPGQMGALWLWVATTHAPVTFAPFIDGRRTRFVTPALELWTRTAPADDKMALLDWNSAELSRLVPAMTIATPAAAAAV